MHRFRNFLLILIFSPVSVSLAQVNNNQDTTYFLYSIGNSHTWDFRPSADFLEIAKAMHIKISNGWHINCGQNLETIWQHPGQTCVELTGYGNYVNAIENYQWDGITIQTFIGGTGRAEKAATDAFLRYILDSLQRDCKVFLYCTWPKNTTEQLADFNYTEAWQSDFREDDTLSVLSAKYFKYLQSSPGKYDTDVQVIPVGRVLYQFDQVAKSGGFPGFTGAGELYRDAWHLNNVGRYIAGLTVFSQIFRIDPEDIPDFSAYHTSEKWTSDRELTAGQKSAIRSMISEVLNF